MTDKLLRRDYGGTLRTRAAGIDGRERVIEGVVIPFGEVVTVQDTPGGQRYRETIAPGAVLIDDPASIRLEYLPRGAAGHNNHDGAVLVGRGTDARVTDGQVWMAHRVSKTSAGDEALELADDGVLTGLSAVFRPVDQRTRSDGVIERTRIDLRRVAVVEQGAYSGAQVTAVRAAAEGDMATTQPAEAAEETQEDEQPATPAPKDERPNRTRVTVDVERAKEEDRERAEAERGTVAELSRNRPQPGLGAIITRSEAVYGPRSEHGFLSDGYRASRGDAQAAERYHRHEAHMADLATSLERAASWDALTLSRASDVLSSEIPGAYPNEYLPGLLTPRIMKGRPMGGFYDRFPISNARPKIYPKVTTSGAVAVQSAEGAALTATDVATTAVTVTPLIYGTYTDVSRQAIDGGDPAAQQMILQDLIEAYSQRAEAVIVTAVEAGSTASGTAIVAATPYAGTLANVVTYQGTRFSPAEGVFVPAALYSVLLAQADTTGRAFLPWLGPTNSQGTTAAGATGANLLGADVFLSWGSTTNVVVTARSNDFVIFESSVATFSYDQVVGPQAIRIGIWAYLVVGARLGSLKVTAA